MKDIIDMFTKNGILVQPEVIDHLRNIQNPAEFATNVLKSAEQLPLVLTLDFIKHYESNLNEEMGGVPDDAGRFENEIVGKMERSELDEKKVEVRLGGSFRCIAREYDDDIKVMKDVTGNSTCEGELKDFANYFNDRLRALKNLLRQRMEMRNAVPIKRVRGDGEFVFIGIVSEVRTTNSNHKLVELEDETDTITALIPSKSPLIAESVVHDEVIGVIGRRRQSNLFIIESILRPEIPASRKVSKAYAPVSAVFLSDIHMGSKTFLKGSWQKFLRWINGHVDEKREIAERVKYLIINGDVVDGIGIYPNQEEDLAVTDIFAQYEAFAEALKNIPDYIKVIILPGNHDAVRPAEPQPAFSKEITDYFDSNVLFVGNPCYFTLHGVEVLAYHGRSMDDFVTSVRGITHRNPIECMKEMLKRRHLAPIYGGKTPIAPECRDYLVIDDVPDIFVTGHVHAFGVKSYRDVILINASAWQSQTDYQRMLGFVPDPAKVSVIDLQTMKCDVVNFGSVSEGAYQGGS